MPFRSVPGRRRSLVLLLLLKAEWMRGPAAEEAKGPLRPVRPRDASKPTPSPIQPNNQSQTPAQSNLTIKTKPQPNPT